MWLSNNISVGSFFFNLGWSINKELAKNIIYNFSATVKFPSSMVNQENKTK